MPAGSGGRQLADNRHRSIPGLGCLRGAQSSQCGWRRTERLFPRGRDLLDANTQAGSAPGLPQQDPGAHLPVAPHRPPLCRVPPGESRCPPAPVHPQPAAHSPQRTARSPQPSRRSSPARVPSPPLPPSGGVWSRPAAPPRLRPDARPPSHHRKCTGPGPFPRLPGSQFCVTSACRTGAQEVWVSRTRRERP